MENVSDINYQTNRHGVKERCCVKDGGRSGGEGAGLKEGGGVES